MGTKLNPGKFDCYAAAKADEPMFVLLARDNTAAILVDLWAQVRAGNLAGMEIAMNMLSNEAERRRQLPKNGEKIEEAFSCASKMRRWKQHNPAV